MKGIRSSIVAMEREVNVAIETGPDEMCLHIGWDPDGDVEKR